MKTKFGIVGCGFLGNIVADAWKKGLLEDYELVGVTSRTFASAEKTAASVGCAACADVDALAFSDCAYLESKSLTQIISTLDILRSELLMQQRFLTAAVTSGTLGASVLNKGALHCQNFSGAAISRVYVAQSSLKGIGILIDPALINMRNPAQNKFPKVNCFWIHNFYVSNINKLSELTPFYDLQINPDENQLSAYLDYTLREYRKANIKSKRYGRYYISLLINILSAASLRIPVSDEPFSSPLLCRVYNVCRHDAYFSQNAPGFSYIFLYLLNRLYTENECSNFTKDFLKKILSLNIVNSYISDFSKIPMGIMSQHALDKLAEDYYLIISADDTY